MIWTRNDSAIFFNASTKKSCPPKLDSDQSHEKSECIAQIGSVQEKGWWTVGGSNPGPWD